MENSSWVPLRRRTSLWNVSASQNEHSIAVKIIGGYSNSVYWAVLSAQDSNTKASVAGEHRNVMTHLHCLNQFSRLGGIKPTARWHAYSLPLHFSSTGSSVWWRHAYVPHPYPPGCPASETAPVQSPLTLIDAMSPTRPTTLTYRKSIIMDRLR